MKITLIAVGKKHDIATMEAVDDFTKRLNHYTPAEWKLLAPAESIDIESERILGALNERDYVLLLDEKGKSITSPGLAEFIEKRLNESTHNLAIIIGGAFGVNQAVRERANFTLKLSDFVFPHQLVRLIIAEQLYRAFTIIKGEKYHHI
jgi:23S rRNA (pseudouridine1915-N3)-methyltransferase